MTHDSRIQAVNQALCAALGVDLAGKHVTKVTLILAVDALPLVQVEQHVIDGHAMAKRIAEHQLALSPTQCSTSTFTVGAAVTRAELQAAIRRPQLETACVEPSPCSPGCARCTAPACRRARLCAKRDVRKSKRCPR